MNHIKEAALQYHDRGWAPLPLSARSKGAIHGGWQKKVYTRAEIEKVFKPDQNVGILLGEASNWLIDLDLDCPEAIYAGERFLPHTLKSRRGQHVSHYWFVAPDTQTRKFFDPFNAEEGKNTMLEVRSNGHQTVVEPSVHPSGDKYLWDNEDAPRQATAEELYFLARKIATTSIIIRTMPDGGRHDFAMHLCGLLARHLEQEDVEDIIGASWEYLDASRSTLKELQDIIDSTYQKLEDNQPVTGGGRLDEHVQGLSKTIKDWWGWKSISSLSSQYTEAGNADKFIEDHGNDIHYVWEWKKWIYWTGKRWDVDNIGHVQRLMKETLEQMHNDTTDMSDNMAKEVRNHIARSLTEKGISGSIKLARAVEGVTISAKTLDRNPMMLTCNNGTYDFDRGKLLNHNRHDFITKLAGVDYNPKAKAPLFDKFMQEILPDPEVREYTMQALGYSISGDVSERSIFIAEGRGRNGKSTLLETVMEILDDYGTVASTEVFLEKRGGGGPNNDVAALKGAYLVKASEVDHGRRLSEALIKNLAGGQDQFSARFLYGEYFSFVPTFKIWILTNSLPNVRGTDDAIWDRIKILPFRTRIDKVDKKLGEKLRKEHPGIFASLVAAYHRYRKAGRLKTPKVVRDRVNKHRMKQDNVRRFVGEKCVDDPTTSTEVHTIYDKYRDWCLDANERSIAPLPDWMDRIEDLGYSIVRESTGQVINGLRLRGKSEGDDPEGKGPQGGGGDRMVGEERESETRREPGDVVPSATSDARESRSEIDERDTLGEDTDTVARTTESDAEDGRKDGPARGFVAPVVDSKIDYDATTHDFSRELDVVAIDIETTGLDPFVDTPRVLAILEGGDAEVFHATDMHDPIPQALERLAGKSLVAHNAAFDLAFLKQHYGFIPTGPVWDTMVLSQIAYAGTRERHGLDACVERELGKKLDKSEQKSDWSVEELSPQQIEYVKEDVRHLPALLDALRSRTEDMERVVELEMNLLPVLVDMRGEGISVDVRGWRDAVDGVEKTLEELDATLAEYDVYGPWTTYKRKQNYQMPVNWNSPQQVLKVFSELGVTLPNTKDDTLAACDHHLAATLRERRKLSKIVSSYGESWLSHVYEDGKVHPSWKQTSTDTGRMACAEPNMQQIPREGSFREMITAGDGNVLVVADYSQIELRIAAMLANEERMLEAFLDPDTDLHSLTAAMMYGREPTKEDRQVAKSANFGLVYGMGAERYRDYVKAQIGVSMTIPEAKKIRDKWLNTYPAIRAWHKRNGNELMAAQNSSDDYSMQRMLQTTTEFGRVRHLVNQYSERLNTPVQGTGADGMKLALLRAAREGLNPVMVIHDELVCEVPEDQAEQAARHVETVMKEEMAKLVPTVPIEVEATVAKEWKKG